MTVKPNWIDDDDLSWQRSIYKPDIVWICDVIYDSFLWTNMIMPWRNNDLNAFMMTKEYFHIEGETLDEIPTPINYLHNDCNFLYGWIGDPWLHIETILLNLDWWKYNVV